MMPSYIDIHTHQKTDDKEVLSIRNSYPSSYCGDEKDNQDFFSVGIHPWYINKETSVEIQLLRKIAPEKQILAIGETGLDKLTETDFSIQENVFLQQIQLAVAVKKPLIIHCVKAWNEVIKILKDTNPAIPVIFHGFRGKPQLADDLIKAGYYLSFGELFNGESLKRVPVDRIFIETDDKKLSVKDVYRKVAVEKNISIETLQQLIRSNFNECFVL